MIMVDDKIGQKMITEGVMNEFYLEIENSLAV